MKTSPVRLIQSISLVATCSSLKYVSLAHLRRTVTYHLQLSDVAFQRHVLVQALILIDFLLTLTEAAKDKKHYKEAQPNLQYKFTLREEDVSQCPPPPPCTSPAKQPSSPERIVTVREPIKRKPLCCRASACDIRSPHFTSVLRILGKYACTPLISANTGSKRTPADLGAQTEWALGIKNSIANYLQDGPDGKFYYRVVDTVLSRDKNWVRWKMDRCKPFTRGKVPSKAFLEARSGAVAAVASKKDRKPAGVPGALRFLASAEPGKGLAQLRQRGR